jgi:general secretion pathway protein D
MRHALWAGLWLAVLLMTDHASAGGVSHTRFTFENADIKTVIAEVARLTRTPYLFDPARVKGTITLLAPADVTPAQAFDLLQSALALHGYAIVPRPEGVWVVPAVDIARSEFLVRVIRLTYADAAEVAATLSWAAPPGIRVVPHGPTNSVVIVGHRAAVELLIDAIGGR